jgi:peptidoglycan/LPS O-acetylase OafA/YrhL
MSEVGSANEIRKFNPSLEGIRGLGFLLVFIAHYLPPDRLTSAGSIPFRALIGMEEIAYFGIPMFFVLSGYLIGGILFATRNREGFFRVYYGHRVLRILPVYYLSLLIIAGVDIFLRFPLDFHFWAYFLFIQNLLPVTQGQSGPLLTIHFWTLATEEQFYLLWPLAVWFFPQRRRLCVIAGALILLIFGIRSTASYFVSSPRILEYWSVARVDGILLGVLLALVINYWMVVKIKPYAKWIALFGILVVALWASWRGQQWPGSFAGAELLIPWINFSAVAIVIAVMEEGSWLNRVCSQTWLCWFGKRSYSLYIFHLIYARMFVRSFTPILSRRIPHTWAVLVSTAIAFSLTVLLSMLSYWLIEKPALRVRQTLKYGPLKIVPASTVSGEMLRSETEA